MSISYLIINKSQYKFSKWSGGKTTQLMIYPNEADYTMKDFIFRISSATVEQEVSVFTSLPGINRFITPLNNILNLTHDDINKIKLQPFQIYGFSGDISTKSYGIVEDFNLMINKNVKGNLINVNYSNNIEYLLFSDEIFSNNSENFEILYSPHDDFTMNFKEEYLKINKQELLIIKSKKTFSNMNAIIKSKRVNNILISRISF